MSTETTGKIRAFENEEERDEYLKILIEYSNKLGDNKKIDVKTFCNDKSISKPLFYHLYSYALNTGTELKKLTDDSFKIMKNEPPDSHVYITKSGKSGKSIKLSINSSKMKMLNDNIDEARSFKENDKFSIEVDGEKIILTRVVDDQA